MRHFSVGDRVMLCGAPNNPEWKYSDRSVPEPRYGVVYVVTEVGVSIEPLYPGEPVLRLGGLESGDHGYAAKYFMRLHHNSVAGSPSLSTASGGSPNGQVIVGQTPTVAINPSTNAAPGMIGTVVTASIRG
jgi:hypothetical protein